MNKALLIWNILITIALAMLVISGCATLDPQFTSVSTQVKENRALIEQIVNLANSNRAAINSNTISITKNTLTIANLQTSTQAAIAATDASLRQLIQTYVATQQ
jgi:hypothetical protein